MTRRISGRGAWNAANARRANAPFDDLFRDDMPKNMSLEVLADLPADYVEIDSPIADPYRHAARYHDERHISLDILTYCHWCKGWIAGEPNWRKINTLEPEFLAGRKGVEYHCQRCGQPIAFFGMVS